MLEQLDVGSEYPKVFWRLQIIFYQCDHSKSANKTADWREMTANTSLPYEKPHNTDPSANLNVQQEFDSEQEYKPKLLQHVNKTRSTFVS